MVSVLHSRSSGAGLSPGWGHSVVFSGKTLYSHCLSPPSHLMLQKLGQAPACWAPWLIHAHFNFGP